MTVSIGVLDQALSLAFEEIARLKADNENSLYVIDQLRLHDQSDLIYDMEEKMADLRYQLQTTEDKLFAAQDKIYKYENDASNDVTSTERVFENALMASAVRGEYAWQTFARIGQKINAIKAFRTQINMGLKEAKDAVEYWIANEMNKEVW